MSSEIFFLENWPRYNGTALYMLLERVTRHKCLVCCHYTTLIGMWMRGGIRTHNPRHSPPLIHPTSNSCGETILSSVIWYKEQRNNRYIDIPMIITYKYKTHEIYQTGTQYEYFVCYHYTTSNSSKIGRWERILLWISRVLPIHYSKQYVKQKNVTDYDYFVYDHFTTCM